MCVCVCLSIHIVCQLVLVNLYPFKWRVQEKGKIEKIPDFEKLSTGVVSLTKILQGNAQAWIIHLPVSEIVSDSILNINSDIKQIDHLKLDSK